MNKPIHFVTEKLKQFREDRDWTQQQLADFLTLQTGETVSREEVNYWENQKRGVTADKALAISDATKIKVMELVSRRDG